jgi:glycosyltransferase involved in cell wall biosynthesis
MKPAITVLMSVRNGERFLRPSVQSVLAQTEKDFEFLIVDDGSTDRTAAILADFARLDRRIRVHTQPENLGLTRSLNAGLRLARASLIARQDADDLSHPERLADQARFMAAHPRVVLLSAGIEGIDAAGENLGPLPPSCPVPDDLIPWMLLFYNYLEGHSVAMFRRDSALAIGGYDEAFTYAQDYELWTRLARTGAVAVLPRILLQLRLHESSLGGQRRDEQRRFAVRCSRRELERIGVAGLTDEDIWSLRNFWKGHFGRAGRPGHIDRLLRTVYARYLNCGKADGSPPPAPSAPAVQTLIRHQFHRWTEHVALSRQPLRKWEAFRSQRHWRRLSAPPTPSNS